MRAGRKQKSNTSTFRQPIRSESLEWKADRSHLNSYSVYAYSMLLCLLLSAFRCLCLLYQPMIDYIIKHSSCSSRKFWRILAYYERITLGMLITQLLPNDAIV